jgi:Flp pilus assembly protein TadG
MKLLRLLRSLWCQEFGQGLVLGTLAMVVILGLAAMTVDVGYWFSQKGEVQKAVDAAALAAAQELPDDSTAAEAKAREYLLKNGVDESKGDTISITFRCTSTWLVACNPATNHWDTIVVRVERPAQAWFARIFGIQEALIEDVHAAGCNGPCGGPAYQPVDVVQILDRTGSMTSTDMTHAKDAAKALLGYFEPALQRVGLATLGPGRSWSDPCSSSEPGVWLPVNLSDDYQNPDGTLDTSSRLVSTINCLQTSSVGTNLGSPMEAATNELVTNGRPGEKWGIILVTDGAANAMPAYDTGYRDCTAEAAVTSGSGDNNGFETNPMNACADDSNYAVDTNSGTSSNTSCGDSGKDRHDFYNYGISVPSGNQVMGIEVRLDAWVDSTSSSTRRMCVELSWDGGNTWTSTEHTSNLTTGQRTYTLGGNGDTWGRTWTPSELSDANFRVRVTDVANSTSRDFSLDWAAVKVYYSSAAGPCDYAAQQADIAKAAGIEVFTIGYGIGSGDLCTDASGAWKGKNALDLLLYEATDSDHFFNEPTKGDLQPIFQVIGYVLAGGSRLVE